MVLTIFQTICLKCVDFKIQDSKDETNVKDVEYQAVSKPKQGGYRATHFIFGG